VLICFTSSHRTARFDLLERLERNAPAIESALRSDDEVIAGAVVLATCNRFEAYLDVDESLLAAESAGFATITKLIAQASDIPVDELRDSSELLRQHEVAEHLFAVSSGLESVVVGEGEIAGQVRRALQQARRSGTSSGDLERLFQGASRASRTVKNGTELSRAGRSIVRLALDLAESRVTDWVQTRVLLVGTGTYAAATLAALRNRGVTDVRVFSRTGRAAAFALKHDIEAVAADGLAAAIAVCDLVVTCSIAPSVIVDHDLVRQADALPHAVRRRLVVDLGLPRNVDPDVAHIDGTELLDLETISLHAPLEELNAATDARRLVGEAAAEFAARTSERDVQPAVVALRKHVYDILDAEIERARHRGDAEAIEAALRHLAGVLLHAPSVRARELAHDGDAESFIAGIGAVFGLTPDEDATRLRAPAHDTAGIDTAGIDTAFIDTATIDGTPPRHETDTAAS
jgi:glutamyl-tRNA reductase